MTTVRDTASVPSNGDTTRRVVEAPDRTSRGRTVRLELTKPQAEALWHLANNSGGAYEDAIALLGHPSKVQAGQTAMQRLAWAMKRAKP